MTNEENRLIRDAAEILKIISNRGYGISVMIDARYWLLRYHQVKTGNQNRFETSAGSENGYKGVF